MEVSASGPSGSAKVPHPLVEAFPPLGRIQILSRTGIWRSCVIVQHGWTDHSIRRPLVKVHFDGFSSQFDDWIDPGKEARRIRDASPPGGRGPDKRPQRVQGTPPGASTPESPAKLDRAKRSTDLPQHIIAQCVSPKNETSKKTDRVSVEMRAEVVEWLERIHQGFKLQPETLNLAVRTFDNYLARKDRSPVCANLVGATALLIASKYEDTKCAIPEDFVAVSSGRYNKAMVSLHFPTWSPSPPRPTPCSAWAVHMCSTPPCVGAGHANDTQTLQTTVAWAAHLACGSINHRSWGLS